MIETDNISNDNFPWKLQISPPLHRFKKFFNVTVTVKIRIFRYMYYN